jgi:HSP20 family protein
LNRMSFWNIEPNSWFIGTRRLLPAFNSESGKGFLDNVLAGFEEIKKEIEQIGKDAPKGFVTEYEASDGTKVTKVGPLVYGYSMTVGPDGKPVITEFGNVKGPSRSELPAKAELSKPGIEDEREPMVDVLGTDKEVKVTAEMPGVDKEKIKIDAYDNTVEVSTLEPARKYHKVIKLPTEANIQTARSRYNNGILEITFDKKKETKPKGKQIRIE